MSEIKKSGQFRIEGCKVVSVIKTVSLEGEGIVGDPYRAVTRYWDFDGELLATADPNIDAMFRAGEGK